jgi:hypothetical protein
MAVASLQFSWWRLKRASLAGRIALVYALSSCRFCAVHRSASSPQPRSRTVPCSTAGFPAIPGQVHTAGRPPALRCAAGGAPGHRQDAAGARCCGCAAALLAACCVVRHLQPGRFLGASCRLCPPRSFLSALPFPPCSPIPCLCAPPRSPLCCFPAPTYRPLVCSA